MLFVILLFFYEANKIILIIDQFHVLRYCFLNNALCLSGSYDCT